jgi:hypothetical protein
VVRAWNPDEDGLEDSLKKMGEIIEGTEGEAEEQDESDDDGWGELGEGFDYNLKSEEMERETLKVRKLWKCCLSSLTTDLQI